jgi:hypothetical protein
MSLGSARFLIALLPGAGYAGTWAINNDYFQNDPSLRAASDFEIILKGDARNTITGGGLSAVTNPFMNPAVGLSLDMNGDTVVRYSGSNSVPAGANNNTAMYHFGVFGSGAPPVIVNAGWSFPMGTQDFPARSFFDIFVEIDLPTTTPKVKAQNNSQGTDNIPDAGFQYFPSLVPLEQLNMNSLPPGSFNPLLSLDGVYAPMQSQTTTLPDPAGMGYLVVYGSIMGNDQQWMEVTLADVTTPEPLTGPSVAAGLAGIVAWRLRRRRSPVEL